MVRFHRSSVLTTLLLLAALLVLSGCSLPFLGGAAGPEPTEEARVLVPTFTPTAEGAAPAAPAAVAEAPAAEAVAPAADAAPVEPAEPAAEPAPEQAEPSQSEPTATPEPEPEPTATPEAGAKLFVDIDLVNVRQGPGTTYGLVGTADQNQELEIIGKNEAGDWWQICCVNGEPGWIFGQLARVENTEGVAVAANIPAPPQPPTPAPAPPPAEPEPAPEEPAAAPPPATDPDLGACGGDDGCKFRVAGGPAFGGNGGLDLKMQLAFVHSGRGDEAQGSYFVVVKKDGVKLPVSDSVRSIAKSKQSGQLGEYNYEFAVGTGDLPGNTVQGSYRIWVLDGNGERDSEPFDFSIDNGENGLLWMKFDQG